MHLTYHQSRTELGPMPSWVVWMVTGESLGSGRRPGEGWAPVSLTSPPVLEAVPVDVEIGALGVGGDPIIHHHYEVLAWLRARLSWIRSFSKFAQR